VKGELAMRVIMERPPKGVAFRVQRGRSDLLAPSSAHKDAVRFDFTVRVELAAGEAPNFLGQFAQGPRAERFIYVNSGKHAGDAESQWDRRAKVHLGGISAALVKRALAAGSVLEARIEGVARDGGPACATVPLLGGGWKESA